ncbi:hypothetical protein [Halomonas sp.]
MQPGEPAQQPTLVELPAQAEANEVSYLAFADMLVEHERQTREAKRIDL